MLPAGNLEAAFGRHAAKNTAVVVEPDRVASSDQTPAGSAYQPHRSVSGENGRVPSALTPFDDFDLRVLTKEDLPLLTRWHADPRVYEWWEGRPLLEEELRAEYFESGEPVTHCLVWFQGRPLGYLAFYRYEVPSWRAAVGLEDGEDAWGFDLFIADPADRDRGLGTRLVAGTLARLAHERGAPLVLIDPHLDNPRAIACYRRAGFTSRRVLTAHETRAGILRDALLMAWSPGSDGHLAEAAQQEQSVGRMIIPGPHPSPATAAAPRFERTRQVARRVTLASIFANALLGVWAVAGSLGEVESRILATSLLVMACGAVAVACGTAIPEGRLGPLPIIGIATAVPGFALLIAGFWENFGADPIWQTGATLVAVAVFAAFASLLSAVHLKGRYRRLLPTAYTLAAAAGVFLVAVVWGYDPGDTWRLFGIAVVLLGAATLAAPIAARLRPAHEAPPPVRFCPYCGSAVDAARVTDCPSCGHRFRVAPR